MTDLPHPSSDAPSPDSAQRGTDHPGKAPHASSKESENRTPVDSELLDEIIDANSHEELEKLARRINEQRLVEAVAPDLARIVRPGTRRWLLGGRYSVEQRKNAIRMIRLLRQPVDAEPFIATIWDRDADLRLEAANTLGEIGMWVDWASPTMAHIIHALKIALRHRYPEIRQASAHALGRLSAWEATDALTKRLEIEKNPNVRDAVALALSRLSGADAVFPLIDSYEEGELDYAVCLDALVNLGDRAVEPLISVVRRWNVRLISRQIAADALGRIGSPAALEPLMVILQRTHEPEDVRIYAARAIGQLGKPEVIQTLRWVYHEPGAGKELVKALEEAIERLDKPTQLRLDFMDDLRD